MPNLKAGIELCIEDVYGAWGLLLASAINPFKFFRVNGKKIAGTQKRCDGDYSKAPLPTDYDFQIPIDQFKIALDMLISCEKDQ